jgi:hypothetical protein
MTEVQALWMDWTRDGRGWYLVNDPEVTFYGEEEAIAYCDEHNRALAENALAENARLREALQLADYTLRGCNMNLRVVERKVSAALAAQTKEQDA